MSWRIYIAVLVLLVLATIAIVTGLQETPNETSDTTRDYAPTAVHEPAVVPRNDRLSVHDDDTHSFLDHRTLDAPHQPTANNQPPTTNRRQPTADSQPPTAKSQQPTETWEDPVNAEVLGSKTWMAPVDEAEEKRVDDVIEKARAARVDPRISHRDRRTSIEVVRSVVDRCYEDLAARVPGSRGRLIVAWESGASAGTGWIRDPRIATNYKLDDATFEACILDGTRGLTFAASDGEARTIEYPFFYED